MLKDFVEIGKLGKPFGISGKLKFSCEDEILQVLKKNKVFFLKRGAHYIPYFVQYIEETHDTLIKIEGFDNPQDAKSCSGNTLYLPIKDLPEIKEKPGLYFSVLKGFSMHDQDNQLIGKIIDVVSMPQQELASVSLSDGNEILIPLHDSLIVGIDPDQMIVQLEIAEGLIDI